nr:MULTISPECIES: universal stress protein [unclassified Cryobacterium]
MRSSICRRERADRTVTSRRRTITGAGENTPAAALLDAAVGADLVIVGSRGHGGFAGLLLGSVSTHVAHHAPCPVLIVRPLRP